MLKRITIVLAFILALTSFCVPAPAQAQGTVAITATVRIDRLNVRRAPTTAVSTVGILLRNQQVPLLGRTTFGDWLQAQTALGIGWIDARFVSTTDNIGLLPVTEFDIPPFAKVIDSVGAFVRLGPLLEYPSLGLFRIGSEFDVIGLHSLNSHVQVRLRDGRVGWVRLTGIRTYGDLTRLPFTDGAVLPLAIVNAFRVRVRTGPGLAFPVIRNIGLGEKYLIQAQTRDGLWYQIVGPFGTGWVQASLVRVVGNTLLLLH